MYSLRHILLRVLRTPKTTRIITRTDREGSLTQLFCRVFSSSRNDGFYREENYDDDTDDQGSSERWPVRSSLDQRSRSSQSFGRNNRPFPSRSRQQATDFHDYDEDFEDGPYHGEAQHRHGGFQSSRFNTRELGSNIKKKEWDTSHLPPLEKNFYVEHPSVAQRSEADIDNFYKSNNIIVKRGERPVPVSHFSEANFPEEINKQLVQNGWTQPTPIQSLGWPLALSGKNMVGIAQTGSGKTLGFVLPALVHIKHQNRVAKGEGPIALVLAPTRELAQQIKSVVDEYGRLLGVRSCCLFGGQSKVIQGRSLSQGPQMVVATPGRLLDFMEMGVINMDRTSYVVLDEADRMLDMGFEPQIRKVLGQIRPDRQMLMWSATWPTEIQQLARDFLGEFTQVNIGSVELMANPNIQQIVHVCSRNEKLDLVIKELENAGKEGPQRTLIFTQTKTQADFLQMRLRKHGFRALALHGDKTQLMRDKTLHSFKSGQAEILVATDVASRGLDVNDIKLVINYDYPNTADDYIHRIGRTARAAKTGTAVTFLTDEDAGKADDLIKVLRDAGQKIPQDLIELSESQRKYSPQNFSRRSNQFRGPYRPNYNRRNSW